MRFVVFAARLPHEWPRRSPRLYERDYIWVRRFQSRDSRETHGLS
jgi:hypothetical protein